MVQVAGIQCVGPVLGLLSLKVNNLKKHPIVKVSPDSEDEAAGGEHEFGTRIVQRCRTDAADGTHSF